MGPGLRLACCACLLAFAGAGRAAASDPERAIAVVVPASHPRTLSPAELALIYRRKKLFWSDGAKVNPVNLQAGKLLRRSFSRIVLGASPEDLEKYWNDMYFHGVSPPFVLTSEEAVLRFVAKTPGAIGYVSFCSADARVSVALVISAAGQIGADAAGLACPRRDAMKTPQ